MPNKADFVYLTLIFSMEWSNSISLQLIELYREHECLWNPVHNDYKNKIKKLDAWSAISEAMKCDVGEAKKKMESLLSSFRRERQKQENTVKTGTGTDEIYKSTWFAFKYMLFLMDKFTPKETKNTVELSEPSTNVQDEEATNDSVVLEDVSNKDEDTQVIESSERATPKRGLPFKSPSRTKRMAVNSGTSSATSRADEAYKILKDTVANSSLRDDSTIYGEHVASKHRRYSIHTRNVIEHLIGNILFNADMGRYEPHESSSSSISTLQNRYYQPNTNIRQQIYTFTPNTTPIPSPSPTDPLVIHNRNSSDSQYMYTPIISPSPSDNSSSQEHQIHFPISQSSLQLLGTTQADKSETSLVNYLNAFPENL